MVVTHIAYIAVERGEDFDATMFRCDVFDGFREDAVALGPGHEDDLLRVRQERL